MNADMIWRSGPGGACKDRLCNSDLRDMLRQPILMPQPIKDRIAKLREEIAQIGEANREYLRGGKKPPGAADHERRLQRLQEIRNELLSLTEWKKP